MKCTIITQTEEIVNYDNILKIFMAEGSYGGEDDYYALVAQPTGTVLVTEEDYENLIQLGIYRSYEKCYQIYESFVKLLKRGMDAVFEIPLDNDED